LLFELYLVYVFSCTVLFVNIGQVIGCEDCLRNDLDCIGLGVTSMHVVWNVRVCLM